MALAPEITVIRGTDTGVGKTVLTALLVRHLRRQCINAAALKPFSSGSRADARQLRAAQDNALSLDQINPFHFPEPLAPLVAARKHRRKISLKRVLEVTRQIDCAHLLIEGAGGLLTPLGENFTLLDIINHLDANLIIVAPNKLGVINHTLLTLRAANRATTVVLMRQQKPDPSAKTNFAILKELIAPLPIVEFPFLNLPKSR